MSDVSDLTPVQDRDAATRIRQQRLIDARAKLKAYRARQGSKASVSASIDQKQQSKRESTILAQSAEVSAKQNHRRSLSKGVVSVGISHNKRASHSRTASRGSISAIPQKPKGHGHTRSRASISLSVSGPAGQLPDAFVPSALSELAAPVASDGDWRSPQPVASTSSAMLPPSHTTPTRQHARNGSRHGRQSSISNFRESVEIVSGGGLPMGALQPAVGSFEGIPSEHNSPLAGMSSPGMPAYINDSAKLLEALKERGRRESEENYTNARSALEALEGRVGAPSEMISLGHSPTGDLMVAPKSPGFISGTASPLAPSPSTSPMIGLGMSSKRKSWSAPDSVVAQGALGPSALGSLAEEDEDEGVEEEDAFGSMPSPKRKGSPRRARPMSLSLAPLPKFEAINELDEVTSTTPTKEANHFDVNHFEVSTPDSAPRRALRPLSLSVPTPPANPTQPAEEGISPGEQRRRSIYQVVSSQTGSPTAESALVNKMNSPTTTRTGGLRSLSISNNVGATDGLRRQTVVRSDSDKSLTSPTAVRNSSGSKRSSISYRNSINPEGPASSGGRRAWNAALHTSNTPSVDMANSFFAYGPTGGPFGGFGDLEVEHSDDESVLTKSPTRLTNKALPLVQDDGSVMLLKQQLSSARQREAEQANHFVEFEKRVGEEAREMKNRIVALETAVEEATTRHTFAVEGLTRELEMAKEAINDLNEERDSLVEDVEGWRTRALKIEDSRKSTGDDNLISAQSKLINQMRDQLYNLHASYEREKAEHLETREENDRLRAEQHAKRLDEALDEFDEEAQIGVMPSMPNIPTRHYANNYSDNSILSVSSLGRSLSGGNTTEETSVNTDAEDTFASKYAPMPSPPLMDDNVSSAGVTAVPLAHSALDILVEEDEETDILSPSQDHGHRGTSGSTGSSSSEVLPLTPVREDLTEASVSAVSVADSRHNRGDSFVRKWRFPQGSISSDRMDDPEEHSFFNLHKHTSLPPLPIPETILPPFLCADLTYDEDMESPTMPQLNRAVSMPVTMSEQHVRRPSSPRPSELTSKRISGQWNTRAPPVAASAYSHAAYQSTSSAASAPPSSAAAKGALARLSSTFSGFGSFGGWGGSQASNGSVSMLPVAAGGKVVSAMLVEEPEEEDVEQTPKMAVHQPLPRKTITAASQPRPVWSPFRMLDFRPSVWSEMNEPIYEL